MHGIIVLAMGKFGGRCGIMPVMLMLFFFTMKSPLVLGECSDSEFGLLFGEIANKSITSI